MRPLLCICLAVFSLSALAYAAEPCRACGDGCECSPSCGCEHPPRAPAGVKGDHVHHKGGWMVSYRYMAMHMEGGRDDDSKVDIVAGAKPLEMDMQMHMVGAMVAPFDRLTFAMMVPYIIKDMDMLRTMPMPATIVSTHTEGIGDIKLAGIYDLWSTDVHQLLLNLAIGLPTGSIDEKNGMGRLGYSMQLGSGSYSLSPAITYTGLANGWGWGAQAKASVPLHKNKHDYRLGNRYDLQGWLLRDLCPVSAVSLRLNGWRNENIDGSDSDTNANPDRLATTRLDLLAGIDYRPSGKLDGARLAIEGGVPLYQYLDGPRLEADWMVVAGLQVSF